MEIQGVFAIQRSMIAGWLPEKDVNGARMLIFKHMYRFPLNLDASKGSPASLNLHNPSSSYKMHLKNGKIIFNVHATIHANITESSWKKGLDVKQMKAKAEQKLMRDIYEDFDKAKRKEIDLYHFEEWLYRHHYEIWKQKSSGGPLLQNVHLGDVKVKVLIDHSNTYKM